MLKKINGFLSILMGTWVGLLLGYVLFEAFPRWKYPEVFDIPDRPWYEEFAVHGLIILALILLTILLKVLFCYLIRKQAERRIVKEEKRAVKEEKRAVKEEKRAARKKDKSEQAEMESSVEISGETLTPAEAEDNQ